MSHPRACLLVLVLLFLTRVLSLEPSYSKNSSPPFTRRQHQVGRLPFAEGQEPIRQSYAGHIPIRSWDNGDGVQGNASLFYWFFPALEPQIKNPPLIIWLQGGPGSSSMISLFYEIGPFRVTPDLELVRHPYTWAKHYSVLFIDQPVGTGYSYVEPPVQVNISAFNIEYSGDGSWSQHVFTESNDMVKDEASNVRFHNENSDYSHGFVTNQRGVVKDMLVFMDEFYAQYPEQLACDLYITGESYAGKFVPSIAYGIHKRNEWRKKFDPNNLIIPLVGLGVGNGLTDPITQIQVHADHALQLGLVSIVQARHIFNLQKRVVNAINKKEYIYANYLRNSLFGYIRMCSGNINFYDVRKGEVQNDWSLMKVFMNLNETRRALHIGKHIKRQFWQDPAVIYFMQADIMKSTAHLFSTLLDHYKVLLYQGQFDFRDGISGNTKWLYQIKWRGAEGLRKAERKVWRVDGILAGYATTHDQLVRIELVGAGHLAPMDQPAAVADMLTRFIEGDKFTG